MDQGIIRIFVIRQMKRIKQIIVFLLVGTGFIHHAYAQKTDTAKHKTDNTPHIYFIITAGDEINAFFNDKPVQASTIDEFNTYVQTNVKSLVNSWVIVTGKPKTGTFDEVMKTLKHNRFKHITTNIKE
ncbi:MAG TPA: hypothetical protein VMI12_03350 [Puia sp.]|nr:hypothetical protein [Puia sp.]